MFQTTNQFDFGVASQNMEIIIETIVIAKQNSTCPTRKGSYQWKTWTATQHISHFF
jgi:hypothetical protein